MNVCVLTSRDAFSANISWERYTGTCFGPNDAIAQSAHISYPEHVSVLALNRLLGQPTSLDPRVLGAELHPELLAKTITPSAPLVSLANSGVLV